MPRFIVRLLFCTSVAWLAGCASVDRTAADDGVLQIRGALAYRERIALPPAAVAAVELTRPQDGRVIAAQRIPLDGRQVPLPFELNVPRAWLQSGTGYALRAAIEVQGRAAWLSDAVNVQTGLGRLDVGTLELRRWEQVALASRLDCGPRTARVGTVRRGEQEVTRLTIDGERHELTGVVAASGARYEAVGDPSTQLWVRGERATLTLRGEALPECVVVRDAPDAVRARGNEPHWQMELGTLLRFSGADVRFAGTAPPPSRTSGGVRRHAGVVAGRTVNVTLTPRVCRDSMSGMPYPYVSEVVIDGRAFRGCGGEPDALLIGDEWVVEDIAGGLVDRSRATFDFGVDGRLAGRASCNAYTTSYALTGERLTIGTTATTMMSCASALMEQERRFLEILQRTRGFDITETGALVLQDDLGRRITARRARP
jgi:heat shock protein HslJ/uncharacterized lipoprotein YbaY